jgi:hypothetical protein
MTSEWLLVIYALGVVVTAGLAFLSDRMGGNKLVGPNGEQLAGGPDAEWVKQTRPVIILLVALVWPAVWVALLASYAAKVLKRG